MLEDSSLAASQPADGVKQVFFQDNSGRVRRTFYSKLQDRWMVPANETVTARAKNHTPIAVCTDPLYSEYEVSFPHPIIYP